MAQTSTGRTAASAAVAAGSLAVATVALRGHVPGGPSEAPARTPDDPVAAAVVIGLLLAAVGVVAVAVVLRLRNPAPAPARVAGRLDWLRADGGGPTRRTWLIVAGAIALAVLLAALVSTLTIGPVPDAPPPEGSTTSTSAPNRPEPPTPAGDVPAKPSPVQRDWNLFGYFYVATAAFLVVLVGGTVVASRRRPPVVVVDALPDDDAEVVAAQSDTLARAAEVGLAAVEDHSRDPRSSIIACYAAMERELARVPGASPRDFDTASEVLARAVELGALRPDSATELVDLFDEARFSPHVMTEAHREAAVDVLRSVLDELGTAP